MIKNDEMKITESLFTKETAEGLIGCLGLNKEVQKIPDTLHLVFDVEGIESYITEEGKTEDGGKKITIQIPYEQSDDMRKRHVTGKKRPNANQWFFHFK